MQLLRGALWNTTAKLVQLLLMLVTLTLIGRFAGADSFGAFALCWVVVGLFEQVLATALSDGLIQQPTVGPRHFDSMLWLLVLLGAAFAGVVMLASEPIAAALGGGSLLAAVLPLRALISPIAAAGCLAQAKLTRAGQFRQIATIEMLSNIGSSLLGIALAAADFGIWSLFWMEATRIVGTAIALFIVSGWLPRWQVSVSDLQSLCRFSSFSVATGLMQFASRSLPRLLIGHGLGAQALGFYAMAERLCDQALRVLVLPGYDVAKAGAARAQNDRRAIVQLLWAAIGTSSLFAYPMLLGAIVLMPLAVPLVLGQHWQPAVLLIQLMFVANLRMPLTAFNSAILIGIGKPQWNTLSQLANMVVTPLLCLAALPYGIEAIGVAMIGRGLVLWPIGALALHRTIGVPIGLQAAAGARHLAAATVMAVAIAMIAHALTMALADVLVILLCVPIAAVGYLHALAWLAPASWAAIVSVWQRLARGERGLFKSLFVAASGARPVA